MKRTFILQFIGTLILIGCALFGGYSFGYSSGYYEGYKLGLTVADAWEKAAKEAQARCK